MASNKHHIAYHNLESSLNSISDYKSEERSQSGSQSVGEDVELYFGLSVAEIVGKLESDGGFTKENNHSCELVVEEREAHSPLFEYFPIAKLIWRSLLGR